MKTLRPFFTYYGGKWRIAPSYPAPRHNLLVEPFAGAAGYAMRYPDRRVHLIDADETIIGIWNYLIDVSESEITSLPDVPEGGTVHDVEWPCIEAKWLAGVWLTRAAVYPNLSASKWARDERYSRWFWGQQVRQRIADQLHAIRHWVAEVGDYRRIKDVEATWFIDPPYIVKGHYYRKHDIDYAHLADWCRSRRGQVIVCENIGAEWLPFRFHRRAKANESASGGKTPVEAIWTNDLDG